MDLTRRQEEFLRNLLDLYREVHEPAHYSLLAERLGVSRFTAYDMLRVLQEKGLVATVYQVPKEHSGPGRSEVLFEPTAKARRLLKRLVGDLDPEDWEAVKERMLERARSGLMVDRALADDILARIPPEEPEVIRYCTEVIVIITLRLRETGEGKRLLQDVQAFSSVDTGGCRPKLTLLSGLLVGMLAGQVPKERLWVQELIEHVIRYQQLVVDMEPEMCERLQESLQASIIHLLAT